MSGCTRLWKYNIPKGKTTLKKIIVELCKHDEGKAKSLKSKTQSNWILEPLYLWNLIRQNILIKNEQYK